MARSLWTENLREAERQILPSDCGKSPNLKPGIRCELSVHVDSWLEGGKKFRGWRGKSGDADEVD